MFGAHNTGLHNLFYPDNARIYRRVKLVIYVWGATMNWGVFGNLVVVYLTTANLLGGNLPRRNLPVRRLCMRLCVYLGVKYVSYCGTNRLDTSRIRCDIVIFR